MLTGLNVFLTFNYHSHSPQHNYHGALWADRAGYFVYLPATFQGSFHADAFPQGIDTLNGNGFELDRSMNIVRTKYTSGVAIIVAPFYVIGHGIGTLIGADNSAFGDVDHAIIQIASSLFLTFGLWFLFDIMRKKWMEWQTLFILFITYFGTNLFYYTVGDPGMSHVYSFFLFCAFLFIQERSIEEDSPRWSTSLLIGAICGLIILVRPTNVLFIIFSPFLFSRDLSVVKDRVISLLSPKRLVYMVPMTLVIWIPQMLYWNFAFGSIITWPYAGEGFTNWASPKLFEFWFSTNNGAFPYVPLLLLSLAGFYLLWRDGQMLQASSTIVLFLTLTYMGASWWVWHFGCGFGSRTMVEYWAVFIFPLMTFFEKLVKHAGRPLAIGLLLLFVIFELKITYSYGNCWFQGDWNWAAYADLVFGPTK